jgi:hypothetical protein
MAVSRRFVPLVTALALAFLASAWAQDHSSSKALLLVRPMGQDPVRVVKVLEGATELKGSGHEFPNRYAWETFFQAGDDWLQDLSFFIKNVSTKNIVYLEVSCVLSETADWQAEIAEHKTLDNPILGQASNRIGWEPEHALYSRTLGKNREPGSTRRPAFLLKPGGEFTISLEDPQDYQSLRSQIEARMPMSSINACNADVARVFFDDGTMWQGANHHYFRAADEPGRWAVISFDDWVQTFK